MAFQFTAHALQQLKERNLHKTDVLETVRNPDAIVPQSTYRFRAIRKFTKRNKQYLYIVIYEVRNSKKDIITAFITSKIKKYL